MNVYRAIHMYTYKYPLGSAPWTCIHLLRIHLVTMYCMFCSTYVFPATISISDSARELYITDYTNTTQPWLGVCSSTTGVVTGLHCNQTGFSCTTQVWQSEQLCVQWLRVQTPHKEAEEANVWSGWCPGVPALWTQWLGRLAQPQAHWCGQWHWDMGRGSWRHTQEDQTCQWYYTCMCITHRSISLTKPRAL